MIEKTYNYDLIKCKQPVVLHPWIFFCCCFLNTPSR